MCYWCSSGSGKVDTGQVTRREVHLRWERWPTSYWRIAAYTLTGRITVTKKCACACVCVRAYVCACVSACMFWYNILCALWHLSWSFTVTYFGILSHCNLLWCVAIYIYWYSASYCVTHCAAWRVVTYCNINLLLVNFRKTLINNRTASITISTWPSNSGSRIILDSIPEHKSSTLRHRIARPSEA